jgi:hypothetical protein
MTKTTVEMLDLYARARDRASRLLRLLGRQIWEAHVFQRGHRPAASDVAEWESTQASRVELERALVDEKT